MVARHGFLLGRDIHEKFYKVLELQYRYITTFFYNKSTHHQYTMTFKKELITPPIHNDILNIYLIHHRDDIEKFYYKTVDILFLPHIF